MNLFTKIKLLFAVNSSANKIKEAYMGGSKPGWKTTEFWLTVLSQAGTLLAAFNGVIPPEKAAIIGAVLTGIYGVVRSLTKATVGDSQPTNAKP